LFRLIIRICTVLSLFPACAVFAQADFSADIVNLLTESNTFHTKIFSTKDKVRFQQEDKNGRTMSITIENLALRTSIVLMPQQHQYVENKRPQIPGQGVTFFQAKEVEDACGDYQKIAPAEKGKCRKVGHETVNGRDAVKYEVSPRKGDAGSIWIDASLHFPVKWQSAASKGELRNIKEAAQPAELFEIPAGYAKRSYGGQPAKPKSGKP
jgi:hypothetical protein